MVSADEAGFAVEASGEAEVESGALDVLESVAGAPAAVPEVLSVEGVAAGSAAELVGGVVPVALAALPAPPAAALLSIAEVVAGADAGVAGTAGCVRISEVGCARSSTGVIISAPTPV